ncbi:NAD(P)H-quinone oxidoreductase [Microbulbifer sp. HZ11]|uniref:NAD(P)H-quinone oxidoreductase n=1 Tax=unclassified Microbulbifer TaxID=2619833 RepID=UPI0009DFEF26|nr:NAD(P)H-quinone oxidoreductase [Microbulbifer sp. HZ11]
MRYIDLPEHGGPEKMVVAEGELPKAGAGEVLIRVAAAGVNRPDIVQRAGYYPPPPGASPVMGLEVAGEVAAVGGGVQRWKIGDRVCALTNGGGYAEYAVAPQGQCLPIPEGLGDIEAAALPETFFTVWSNLMHRAHLQSGEVLLVHGGSSGIGTTAIQIAANLGVRVFTTAGSDRKCAVCEQLGAEQAINYREQDFVETVLSATGGNGANVILDMVGGAYVDRNIQCAARDGRIVNIAFLNGAKVEVNMLPVMLKRLTLTGSTLRPQPPEVKEAIARDLEQHVWPLIAAGKIRPHVTATYPLQSVADAHRKMESGESIGKIVLVN